MSKYSVLDDVGLSCNKTEIEECLKLRYDSTSSSCILSVDYLYCLISSKIEIVVYKMHIIHNKQYVILSDLLHLLSNLESYLHLSTKRLLIEEKKVREKLDDLSTKKLRTKNTVKTSEELRLSKDLQRLVNDDYCGLRQMREATFSTLDAIITDRANTLDIESSLRFIARRIQNTFPIINNGNYQQFALNNIQYNSDLSLMMEECHSFLVKNHILKGIIRKNNLLIKKDNNEDLLYFDGLENENIKDNKLDLSHEFNVLKKKINVSVCEMKRYCSTLKELFQLKKKLGKQLVKIVKYHWK